jgi:hypothetical protein
MSTPSADVHLHALAARDLVWQTGHEPEMERLKGRDYGFNAD